MNILMTDLVLGSAFNLNWNQVALWAKSLRASGYSDDAILVYFGTPPQDLVDELGKLKIQVALFSDLPVHVNVCVCRFAAYNALLSYKQVPKHYNWVIATDVTDVVFQANPSLHLENLNETYEPSMNHVASSENLIYKNEYWGKNNLTLSFGEEEYLALENKTIYNAGVIAAKHDRMADISRLIWQMCNNRPQHIFGGGGPDQAAYNIILNMVSINTKTHYAAHDEEWACQCGTNLDPSKPFYKEHLIETPPFFNGTFVVNSDNIPYNIVHQYNRVPELKEYFERKYNV